MNVRQNIPNTITSLNLVSGLVSIIFTMEGRYVEAAVAIVIAALFDFLDGSAARWLKVWSELGKQLDSLADVVSFGVAPGLMVYQMISVNCAGSCNILEQYHITPYFALLIPVFSALRLAKFNIDLKQEVNFIGLPTPANAIFFASIPLVLFLQPQLFAVIRLDFLEQLFSNTRVLTMLAVFFSYLLVSDMKIFSMKFKTFGWKGNELRISLVVLSALFLMLFSLAAIPLIIVAYLLLSLFFQQKING
jgi:CDP-diacylglycerol--serine O-phosphatidyltransferase